MNSSFARSYSPPPADDEIVDPYQLSDDIIEEFFDSLEKEPRGFPRLRKRNSKPGCKKEPLLEKSEEAQNVANQFTKCQRAFFLGNSRYCQVKKWRGQTEVVIRETYAKQGESKVRMGRNGINLTIKQWQALISNVNNINQTVIDIQNS